MQYIRDHTGLVLVFVGAMLAIAVIAGAITQIAFREDTKGEVDVASEHRQEIVDAQVASCEADQELRQQYRVRGQGEADIFRYFIKILPASPFATAHPELAERAVAQFQEDLDRIKILPVPDCDALRERLAEP